MRINVISLTKQPFIVAAFIVTKAETSLLKQIYYRLKLKMEITGSATVSFIVFNYKGLRFSFTVSFTAIYYKGLKTLSLLFLVKP